MGKLKALLLTEGMHGMISQVEGMAKALNSEYSHRIVRLSFPWNLIPPKFTPISQIILKDKIYITENEIPDIIISCGRKSVIPSIFLKRALTFSLKFFFAVSSSGDLGLHCIIV